MARTINDTLIPIKLHLSFTNNSVALLPSSDRKFKAFIFSELSKSQKQSDYTTTFLVDNRSEKPLEINKMIQPGETYPINLELFFNSDCGITRTTYAQIQLKNPNDKQLLDDTLIREKRINILLNVSLESNSATILCGYLFF